jgi:hypothetical protein
MCALMRKLPLLLICLFCFVVRPAHAQLTALQAREAEWKNYSLPQTNFTRQTDANKDIVFRVPADWKQEGTELTFNGPHSSQIQVSVQKIPNGYPLTDYVGSILQSVRSAPCMSVTFRLNRTIHAAFAVWHGLTMRQMSRAKSKRVSKSCRD